MKWCWLGIHDWEEVRVQRTKNACYGYANLPGMRLTERCKHCGKTIYIRLNMAMPLADLYKEYLWKD